MPFASFAQTTLLTGQSGSFALSTVSTVSYGGNGAFNSKTLAAGTYVCGDQLFGDPAPGIAKSCYVPAELSQVVAAATTTTSTSTVMTLLTGQSGSFKLTSTSAVAYGSGVLM
ncbi:hypothetical protein ACSFA3_20795, partial [Variovorax sp. RHLX14]